MIDDKNTFLTVSWLSGLLSAEILLSAQVNGGGSEQMPPLTTENSHFLRSVSQEAALVMHLTRDSVVGLEINMWYCFENVSNCCLFHYYNLNCSNGTNNSYSHFQLVRPVRPHHCSRCYTRIPPIQWPTWPCWWPGMQSPAIIMEFKFNHPPESPPSCWNATIRTGCSR